MKATSFKLSTIGIRFLKPVNGSFRNHSVHTPLLACAQKRFQSQQKGTSDPPPTDNTDADCKEKTIETLKRADKRTLSVAQQSVLNVALGKSFLKGDAAAENKKEGLSGVTCVPKGCSAHDTIKKAKEDPQAAATRSTSAPPSKEGSLTSSSSTNAAAAAVTKAGGSAVAAAAKTKTQKSSTSDAKGTDAKQENGEKKAAAAKDEPAKKKIEEIEKKYTESQKVDAADEEDDDPASASFAKKLNDKKLSAKQRSRLRKKLLDSASADIILGELFSEKNIHRYIDTSQVTTTSGVVWIDVRAKESMIKSGMMKRQPEGQFASAVMRSLHTELPADLYAKVASGSAFPYAHVEKNWLCLLLRIPKTVTTMSGSTRSDEGSSPPVESDGLLSRFRKKKKKECKAQQEAKGERDQLRSRFEKRIYGDGADPIGSNPDDYYYDEDTNQFYIKRKSPFSSPLSRLRREKSQNWMRGKDVRTPTFSDLTDRLTVFIWKELYEVEAVAQPDAGAGAATATKDTGTNGSADKKTAASGASTHADKPEASSAKAAEDRKERIAKLLYFDRFDEEIDLVQPNDLYRWIADSTDMSSTPIMPKTPPPPTTNKVVVLDGVTYEVRFRVVTVHRYPIPYIDSIIAQWDRLISGEGIREDNHDPTDGLDVLQRRTPIVSSWEDVVRLIFHGAVEGFQRHSLDGAHTLDYVESSVFESHGSPAKFVQLTTQLTQLRLLARQANINEYILKEMKVAYIKLKKILHSPLTDRDQRDLRYLESAVAVFGHMEEHSDSLLFLQLQVAMNEMEYHLRTLTVFSTFFIPLDFAVSFFGMNFKYSILYQYDSRTVGCLILGVLFAIIVGTLQFIKRFVRTL